MADKYPIDRDAPKLDLLGEKPRAQPKAVLCPIDSTEMNYHVATDQWQCPQCGAVSNGGKPQSEIQDHGNAQKPDALGAGAPADPDQPVD